MNIIDETTRLSMNTWKKKKTHMHNYIIQASLTIAIWLYLVVIFITYKLFYTILYTPKISWELKFFKYNIFDVVGIFSVLGAKTAFLAILVSLLWMFLQPKSWEKELSIVTYLIQ